MKKQEIINGIREQLKAIKEALTVIEFKLSQLESESQAPAARSEQQQPAKRPPGFEERPALKLKVRRSNRQNTQTVRGACVRTAIVATKWARRTNKVYGYKSCCCR
jgi:hypothetical protein